MRYSTGRVHVYWAFQSPDKALINFIKLWLCLSLYGYCYTSQRQRCWEIKCHKCNVWVCPPEWAMISNKRQDRISLFCQCSMDQSKFVDIWVLYLFLTSTCHFLGGKSAQNTAFYYLNSSSASPESPSATSNHKTAHTKQILLPKSLTSFIITSY